MSRSLEEQSVKIKAENTLKPTSSDRHCGNANKWLLYIQVIQKVWPPGNMIVYYTELTCGGVVALKGFT